MNTFLKSVRLFILTIISTSLISGCVDAGPSNPNEIMWVANKAKSLEEKAPDISPKVLCLALDAYYVAHKEGIEHKSILTVVDFSLPSNKKRLWVFDVKNNRVLFDTYVTHGKNSGRLYATQFSNKVNSLESSIGVYLTEYAYNGTLGYSMRVKGLDKGFNDHAEKRNVVFHGAWYAEADMIKKYGQLGRSWGCFAVGTPINHRLINTIKQKTLVFAYYPDNNWLDSSVFLN